MNMRQARLAAIRAFIAKNIDRKPRKAELESLNRLSNQTLHLLAAAIDNLED